MSSRSLALFVALLALVLAPSVLAWHSQCAAKRGKFTYEGGLLSTGKPRKGAAEKAPSCCAKCKAAAGCSAWTYDGKLCSYFDSTAVKTASATVQWYGAV